MEQNEAKEPSASQVVPRQRVTTITPSRMDGIELQMANEESCPACAGAAALTPPSYVYALGRVEARFTRRDVEKEFAQVIGRTDTSGKTDREAFHSVLSLRENRYLSRQMCWVMSIQGLDTYILRPRDPADFDLLLEAIRPRPSGDDIDIVVGVRGPIAPPELCNGLTVPVVGFSQIYSFHRDALIKAIPCPEKIAAEHFEQTAQELFDRVIQITDNAGATDEHRALNYIAVRYPAIYQKAADGFARDFSLTSVDVRRSPLSGTLNIVEVILSLTHRNTDFTEKYFMRVDVTEEFPFLVTKMSPYYDR